MTAQELLFATIRSAICNMPLDPSLDEALTLENIVALYKFADRQDLAHIPGHVLGAAKLLQEDAVSQNLKTAAMRALYRHVQREHEFNQICKAFEEEKMPFIPLKGTVLRDLYPQPWMRTSCDTDILVKTEDLERAVEILRDRLGYTDFARTEHDIGCKSPGGLSMELHFDTVQERYADQDSRAVLARVWDESQPVAEGASRRVMSDAMFYYYHMAHMAKHFTVGGCGIRPVLDTWLLNHKVEFDREARGEMLRQGGLDRFAAAIEKLSEVWFSCAESDEMTDHTGAYILRAGLYGDHANRAALGQAKMGGKLNYFLFHRVFLPYEHLKAEYPALEGRKWLLPVYQVKRWFGVLQRKEAKRRIKELQVNAGVSREQTENARRLINYLGLEQ